MEKHRTTLSLLLVVIGASLLFYGLFAKGTVVSSDEPPETVSPSEVASTPEVIGTPEVAGTPEPAVTQEQQEVAKDEVKPAEPTTAKETKKETKKAPPACPT